MTYNHRHRLYSEYERGHTLTYIQLHLLKITQTNNDIRVDITIEELDEKVHATLITAHEIQVA